VSLHFGAAVEAGGKKKSTKKYDKNCSISASEGNICFPLQIITALSNCHKA